MYHIVSGTAPGIHSRSLHQDLVPLLQACRLLTMHVVANSCTYYTRWWVACSSFPQVFVHQFPKVFTKCLGPFATSHQYMILILILFYRPCCFNNCQKLYLLYYSTGQIVVIVVTTVLTTLFYRPDCCNSCHNCSYYTILQARLL